MILSTGLPLVPLPKCARLYRGAELISELRRRSKIFVTFLGFGELGYEDEDAMRLVVRRELETRSRADTIVNSGTLITAGFHSGIAEAYREAKAMGFATMGIHPSVALRDPSRHHLSPFVDETFFVEDDSWGGYLPGTRQPSPTLRVLVAVSDQVLAIGGGRHTADEMREFLHQGVPVRYHEAEMNHGVGVAWYRTRGITDIDFRGEAYLLWQSTRGEL
jgi:hypothetical protein